MGAVRQWVNGFILVHGIVGMAPQGYAQQAGSSDTSPQPLEPRVDDLGQQIRILQQLRERKHS